MVKVLIVFVFSFMGVFIVDQSIKSIFLDGFRWYGDCFSLILTFNKGVAFSMLAFLEGNLKYLQIVLLGGIFVYLVANKELFKSYSLPAGIILGAGFSNVYDRFIYGGVVDYFYWHKWFNFAVFNFADVMINVAVIIILLLTFVKKPKSSH